MSHRPPVPEQIKASNLSKNLATAGMSEVDTAIIKCTYEDDTIPKEKHVQTLIKLSDFDTSFLTNLFRRIGTRNYRVVLKTLLVLHRLTRQGSIRILESLETRLGYLQSLFTFNVRDSPLHARLIRQHSSYLHEKGRFFKDYKISPERDTPSDAKKWALDLSEADVFRMLPALQQQMDKLLLVDPTVHFMDGNIKYLFTLLQRDAIRLYSVCSVLIYASLEKVEDLNRENTAIFLQCCRNSISLDDRFLTWHNTLLKYRLTQDSVPAFQKIPDRFVDLLESQLAEFDANEGHPQGEGYKLSFFAAISSTRRDAERNQTPRANRNALSPTSSNKSPFYNDKLIEDNFSPTNRQQQSTAGAQTYKQPAGSTQRQATTAAATTTGANSITTGNKTSGFDTWDDTDEWGQFDIFAAESTAFTAPNTNNGMAPSSPNTVNNMNNDPFMALATSSPPSNQPMPQQQQQQQNQTPNSWAADPFSTLASSPHPQSPQQQQYPQQPQIPLPHINPNLSIQPTSTTPTPMASPYPNQDYNHNTNQWGNGNNMTPMSPQNAQNNTFFPAPTNNNNNTMLGSPQQQPAYNGGVYNQPPQGYPASPTYQQSYGGNFSYQNPSQQPPMSMGMGYPHQQQQLPPQPYGYGNNSTQYPTSASSNSGNQPQNTFELPF